MIQQPSIDYCGLLIVIDKPSRFDIANRRLFSGWAGDQFKYFLNPLCIESCCLMTVDELKANPRLVPDKTRVILFLGEGSLDNGILLGGKDLNLNEVRGNLLPVSPYHANQFIAIASFAPQDAFDRKNMSGEADESGAENLKSHGSTKRRNWRWWLMSDVTKVKNILNKLTYGANIKLIEDTPERAGITKYIGRGHISHAICELKDSTIVNPANESAIYPGRLVLDIETDKHLNLTCIGFLFSETKKLFVIPIKGIDGKLEHDYLTLAYFFRALAQAMATNEVICHNAMFDLFVLALRYKIPFPKNLVDTMLVWHRCFPEVEKSLGHLCSFLINVRYHKNDGVFDPKTPAEQMSLLEYNAQDVFTTWMNFRQLRNLAIDLGAKDSADFACSMVRPYLTMQYQGMRLNKQAFIEGYEKLSSRRRFLDRMLRLITQSKLNPRSSQQVGNYLYETLDLDCPDEKQPTNEKTLLKLLASYKAKTGLQTIPSVNIILASRECGKLASSMKFCLWDKDYITRSDDNTNNFNRVTTAYNLAGTDTFRLSSRALLKFPGEGNRKGWGTNVQNWDKSQRRFIIPDEGKVLIQADQAGAEALIVAYLCRNGKFRELFVNNIKPHVFVALHLFADKWKAYFKNPALIDTLCSLRPRDLKIHPGFKAVEKVIKESDSWPDKERYYFIAKMVCHACNYGMKAPTFALNVLQKSKGAIVLTVKEAAVFIEMYHRLFPEIHEWHQETIMALDHDRVLRNLFNEPRRFLEFKGETLNKQAFAFKPQSTVGQITNRGIVKIQELIEDQSLKFYQTTGADVLQNNHDSILIQAYDNPAAIHGAATVLHEALTPILTYKGETFRMRAEVQVGRNWAPKSSYNPDGMEAYELN